MKLTNKVAIVTGGGRGIGKAISLTLAAEGATVVIAATTMAPAEAVVEEITANGGQALALQTDVTNFDQVKQTVATTIERFGQIDILINNAGGSARGKMTAFSQSDESTWDYVLNTNLKGVLYTCRAVINPMIEHGSGCIINIGSVAGIIGLSGQADYSASKGAVIAFTQALAKETSHQGIRVNCVSPGPTKSEAARAIPEAMRKNLAVSALVDSTGFDEFAEADHIASLVGFLATDEAGYITGQNYPVCGVMNLGLNKSLCG